jgi:hypothetical protein
MIDSETKINADGIFLSCSQGQNRLWEFHPEDVTSVGAYSEDGRIHEVIVIVNRQFDVAEGTPGLEELNGRLSKELKSEIKIDSERVTSPFGVVVWPPHLAGNALWEFYIVGKDGLSRKVSPGAPNALRELDRPLIREMRRNAKLHLPSEFPESLVDRGFVYHGEIGWLRDDAVVAAQWLRERGAAIDTAELWLVKNAVVQPHIQGESGILTHRYSARDPAFRSLGILC